MTPGFDPDRYGNLLLEHRPRVIADEEDFAAAQEDLDGLLALDERSPEQDALLDLLTTLIEDWERREVEIPELPARDVIRFLLDSRGLPQRALVGIFRTESIVSEVLAGRRKLQTSHIRGLAEFFACSPATFFGGLENRRRRVVAEPPGEVA